MDPQDENTTPETAEENPSTEAPEDGDNGSSEDETPETEVPADVLRANLTKANQEAAKYRTRLREVEKALAERKTDEDVESLLNEVRAQAEADTRALLVEAVALKFNLPDALAARLNGSTREELEADAQALAAFAPKQESEDVPPGDLNGGLNPGSDSGDDGLSPRDRVRKIKGYA